MAWVERLSSGKWRGGWRDPAGKKCYTTRTEFPEHPYARKREALEAAQEAEVAARRQAAVTQGIVSATIEFGEWWDRSTTSRTDTDNATTRASIHKLYLKPRWDTTPLNGIAQRDIKAWVADLLGKGLEPSYVGRIYGELRHSLNLALEAGVLTATPCVGVKIPKVRRKAKAFVDEDYLQTIRKHLPKHYQAIIDVGLETGLRPGELAGLHADTLDLDGGWLTVSRVLVGRTNVIRGFPKDADVRMVPLTETAIRVLRERLAGRDLTVGCGVPHADGKPCRSQLVFLSDRRTPIRDNAWWTAMKRASDAAEVKNMGPYAVRRGFATRAARGGIDAFELAEIMGHADIRQTQAYVQQSSAVRDRLRLALGGGPRLRAVGGNG